MSVPADIVGQSVFTAALFLTFISVPKLVVLTIWYTSRIFSNRIDKWIVHSKIYKNLASKSLVNYIEKETENSVNVLLEKLDQWMEFTEKVRDPIIESVVALALLIAVYSTFPQVSLWITLSVHAIVVIWVWAALLWLHITYESRKLPISEESEILEDEEIS